MKNQKTPYFLSFLLLVVILRAPSFFSSSLDADESLYILMGRSIIEGQIPYVAIWDSKPVGMAVLFALAQIVLGNSTVSISILACIAVWISCYLLYLLGRVIGKDDIVGIIAGTLYAIYTSSPIGLACGVEILFNPFIIFAFYLFFSGNLYNYAASRTQGFRLILIGLSFGMALQIKYSVLLDFMALFIIITISLCSVYKGSPKALASKSLEYYALLMIGPVLIFLSVVSYFIANGNLGTFIYANFTANKIYFALSHCTLSFFLRKIRAQVAFNFLWFCLFWLPFYIYFLKNNIYENRKKMLFLIVWFLGAFLAVSSTKQFFNHYFLQLLPSLCLISSILTFEVMRLRDVVDRARITFILALIQFYLLSTVSR